MLVLDWNPNDPDTVKVHYDVGGWSLDQRVELSEALAQDTAIVLAPVLQLVDELVALGIVELAQPTDGDAVVVLVVLLASGREQSHLPSLPRLGGPAGAPSAPLYPRAP